MQPTDAQDLERSRELGIESVIISLDTELWARHERVETVMDLVAENIRQGR